MVEILLLIVIAACLFDALVSWSSALGIAYMRHHVPFCEQKNREQEQHHQEQWS